MTGYSVAVKLKRFIAAPAIVLLLYQNSAFSQQLVGDFDSTMPSRKKQFQIIETKPPKEETKPYASFPEIWRTPSVNYSDKYSHRRMNEESKWTNKIFNEVSNRFKLNRKKHKIQQTNLSCRVVYRIKADKTIEIAFTKKSTDAAFDSFLNGIFKSLDGSSILVFPQYVKTIEAEKKRKCLAVSFEYNIYLNASGALEKVSLRSVDYRQDKSKKSRMMFIIDDRAGIYDQLRVRYYFKEKGV